MANTPLQNGFVVESRLTERLQHYRKQVKKSLTDIAVDAWMDVSYVSRLFSGERRNPRRDALILLTVFGMELGLEEVNDLLFAAEYAPLAMPSGLALPARLD